MVLSRLPQKAFVLVAGGDVKVINIDHRLGLPYSEWALSRGENECNGTYATSEKSLSISSRACAAGGLSAGGEKICVISLIVTIHELDVREHAHVERLHAGGRRKRYNPYRSLLYSWGGLCKQLRCEQH